MRALSETATYLGSWRWDVMANRVVVGEEIACAYGIDPLEARDGVSIESFAEAIFPDDKSVFFAAIEKATAYGGELNFAYRLLIGENVSRVHVVGDCVKAIDGQPAEYLGATHVCEEYASQPIIVIADHLIAAAQSARAAGEVSLAYFIDMALFEAGSRIAIDQQLRSAGRPRVAISNG